MKYSIILPIYKDRKKQFKLGLLSYSRQQYDMTNVEIIVIDQGNDENIEELFTLYPLNIKHIKIDLNKAGYPDGQNPSYAQNVGFKHCTGSYVILTSPEVVFESTALKKLDDLVRPDRMIYCSVGECSSVDPSNEFTTKYLQSCRNGMWLCHSKSRPLPMAYFMGVLSKQAIMDIQGIDEDFMQAIGYDDDDFGKRIGKKLAPMYIDNIVGSHITHSRKYQQGTGMKKVNIGRSIYETKNKMKSYPIVANTNREWGSDKGIIEITNYIKGKKINDNNEPLITVFTSCYNQGDYLKQSIESVLNQTYRNIQYLIYDDGSTDNTWNVIQHYQNRDQRITAFKLPKQNNVGVVINRSINDSLGKYWTWCPSDDIWLPNLLENKFELSKTIDSNSIIYSDWIHINSQGNELNRVQVKPMNDEEFWKEVWKSSPIGFTGIWIPINVFKITGMFPEHHQYSEDFAWMIQATIHKIPFVKCPYELYKKRLHDNRLSVRHQSMLVSNSNKIRQQLREKYNFKEYQGN